MTTPTDSAAAEAPATTQRTAAIVYNPVKVHLPTLQRTIARYEQDAGWNESLWFATTVDDPGGGMARAALAAGADVVAAAGGDGTTRLVAEVVHGSDAALALLPSGTGNLLARNMRLPIDDLGESARAMFHGEDREIDFGQIGIEREDGSRERHGFLVMAGLGLDARMLANTRPQLKKRVGWLAYVDAVARSLRDLDAVDFRYRLDDEGAKSLRAHALIVGNCGTLQANMLLLPEASIDDGVFDIVAMRPRSVWGWMRIGARLFWENAALRRVSRTKLGKTVVGQRIISRAGSERPLRYMRGQELTVRLDKPDEFEIDGDSVGRISAFRAQVEAASLRVRVPVGHVLHV
ncbi:diacylglycerol/lipid kinase family protein [Curtobacterium sp. Leaf261]|uniref:diacylglycerol/lipid kinase family protein n=1 Tax=Curtobacterium sp. Leaf261 TaxID=1736311 RepID=UPI0006FCAE6B|nr:diacylglycerol kinase family protein [Curtobacterium sp. Leaf261]KQO60318.1 diacylglycerol kinase [Curtobacterium sp. Leaf261]